MLSIFAAWACGAAEDTNALTAGELAKWQAAIPFSLLLCSRNTESKSRKIRAKKDAFRTKASLRNRFLLHISYLIPLVKSGDVQIKGVATN